MKQEEKDLLLQELCARLPYGVKCQIKEFGENFFTLKSINIDYKNGHLLTFEEKINDLPLEVYLSEVKPCLISVDSMTSDEFDDFFINESVMLDVYDIMDVLIDDIDVINKLNKRHFDYRGLIEKGLAVDCTNLNIY
jgi:hypothetical protein